jgi:uncharacterized protein YjiS (DUF1127 family)
MTSTLMQPSSKGRKTAFSAPFGASILVRAADSLVLLLAKQRSRSALAQLDDRMLRDIGIDRATAATEAERPMWR